jgi:hypothetical protein
MFPPDVQKAASFYHLGSTVGQTQPYSSTADVVTTAAMLPMDRKVLALEGIRYLDPWELYVDPTADIRVGDKVTIAGDSANYYVQQIFKANFGGLPHQRAVISKSASA